MTRAALRMLSAACSMAVAVATLAAGDARAATAAASPEDVYRAFAAAMADGRAEEAGRFATGDVKRLTLITARPAAVDAEKRFKAAVEATFPGGQPPVAYGGATTRPEDAPATPRVIIEQDTATMINRESAETVHFRRVDGQWKVDLNAMYSPAVVDEIERYRGALTEVMNAVAAEIKAGRFKKIEEVQADLATRIKMRLATPDFPATTRPAF